MKDACSHLRDLASADHAEAFKEANWDVLEAKCRIMSFLAVADQKYQEMRDEEDGAARTALHSKCDEASAMLQKIPSLSNEAGFLKALKSHVTPASLQQLEVEMKDLSQQTSGQHELVEECLQKMHGVVGTYALLTVLRNQEVSAGCAQGKQLRDMVVQLVGRYGGQLSKLGPESAEVMAGVQRKRTRLKDREREKQKEKKKKKTET